MAVVIPTIQSPVATFSPQKPIVKTFNEFDASLDTVPCDRYNNAELTLTMRVYFDQNNPAGGVATGLFNDYNDPWKQPRAIEKWKLGDWALWKSTFINQAQTFWSDKIWLVNDSYSYPYVDKGVEYYPNVWCRLRLVEAVSAANAHHSVLVSKLAPTETFAGSNTQFFDSNDVNARHKDWLADGVTKIMQRASVHEIGHLLGLPHINYGKGLCVGRNINHATCYGITDVDKLSVMGSGEVMRVSDATPWQNALIAMTPIIPPLRPGMWPAKLSRHYPRTKQEMLAGTDVKVGPNRG